MSRALLVEDDELVGTMVHMNLASLGYEVTWERRGDTAAARMREPWDVVLLDISLPGQDGFSLLEELRREGVGTPVIMLTAQSEVASKVKALSLGADDYLTKPFDVSELVARVEAQVRRARAQRELPTDQILRVGVAEVDLATRQLRARGEVVTLTEKEAGVLRMLAQADGQVVSRVELLDEVWGLDEYPTERTVDNHILHLRKLIEPQPGSPRHVRTVRGQGYRLVR